MDDQRLFAGIKGEATRLTSDIISLGKLRWQLASLEATAAARTLKGLAFVLLSAALAALVALAVLVVALADVLDGCVGLARWTWLFIFGAGLLGLSAFAVWKKLRHFQREFVGFEQSLEELREDIIWLRERFAKLE
jgi:hypothetical protein